MHRRISVFWVASLCTATVAAGGDWPAFRGPSGNGVAAETKAPLVWGPGKNVRWKVALPGPGNSSPIVSNGRVFVTCAEDQGRKRNVYCFDRQTGKERWEEAVRSASIELTHRTNPYCASTPVADGTRVVVWHGSAGVFCYDFDGHSLWNTDLGKVEHVWGYASSPIIHRGKVFLNFGPGPRTFLAALDLKTGALLWKVDEPGGVGPDDKRLVGSWSTPIVIHADGKDQILCAMPTRVIACDPDRGTILWTCSGLSAEQGDMVFPSPVIAGDIGVAITGFISGPAIGFRLGGKGDVTATRRLWREKQTQAIGSGVVVDGRLYIANSGPATAQCIDCRTGKALWTARLDAGPNWGSLVLAAGRLYVTSRRGITTIFRPNPHRFELLATNDLGEASNATPAISDGQIFLRTDGHLYCIAEN
jgi:outer membrane protein assembly factor BamB